MDFAWLYRLWDHSVFANLPTSILFVVLSIGSSVFVLRISKSTKIFPSFMQEPNEPLFTQKNSGYRFAATAVKALAYQLI